MCNAHPLIEPNIAFSDDATLTLTITVNQQNCRYWLKDNTKWKGEHHTQYPQKIID